MPDTNQYLVLGLIAFFTIIGLYLLSLYLRYGNASKDIRLLQSLWVE